MAEFYQVARNLDRLTAGDVNETSIKSLLDTISKDTAYEDYFFRTIHDLRWFIPLKNAGYFDPKTTLQPKRTEGGGYEIPPWNVLKYLEYVSEQTSKPKQEWFAYDLQDIIRNVTCFHVDNQRLLDNFHIWWSFVNILCNLPNRTVAFDIVDLVETWLDTRFGLAGLDTDFTKRLIPKFLNSKNREDQKKAERLIIALTKIKFPSRSKIDEETWIRRNDPDTVIESYWLRKFFKKFNDRIAKTCSSEVVYSIMEKMITVLRWERGNVWKTAEYRNKKYIIDTSLTDTGDISFTIGLIDGELTIDKEPKTFERKPTSNIILTFIAEAVPDGSYFTQLVNEKFSVERDLAGMVEDVGQVFFENLYESLFVDYSYIWFPSLYKNPSVGESRADVTLVAILKDLILAKAKHDPTETRRVMDNLLAKKPRYPILGRLVFYLVGNRWNDFNDFFHKMLEKEGRKYFNDPHYEPELYKTLEINNKKIADRQKELIKEIVEQGPIYSGDGFRETLKIAAWKQKWYFPLRSDPEFGRLYKACTKIVKVPQDRLLYKTTSTVRSGPGPSPLTKEEILELSATDLVAFLKDFRTKDSWEGPTVGGLSQILKEAVKTDPQKFNNNLFHFEDCGFIYIYEILSSFHDAWRDKKKFDWGNTLDFIHTYIDRESFWNDEFVVEQDDWLGGADHLWVVGMVAELIQEGTRKDSWAFPDQYNEKVKEILFLILNRLSPEEDEFSDYVSHALNSPAGKVITAVIYLVLRITRLKYEKKRAEEPMWGNEYRSKYDELLGASFIDAYTLFGRYLPNFFYLDRKWASEKIVDFIPMQTKIQWEAFIDGYFSIGKLYDDLYDLMNEHYSYAISHEFTDHHNREYLVQHISLAYLRKRETLDNEDSILRKLITIWDTEDIREMVDFFWGQREVVLKDQDMRDRVLAFWERLFNTKYKEKDHFNNKENSLLSSLAKLAVFLTTIDSQTFEWLLVSVPHVEGFEASYIIKYLDKYDERQSVKYAGRLLLKMVESRRIDHEKDRVLSIVQKLYKNDETKVANGICNAFGMRGDDFLREIYDEFNPAT